MTSQLIRLIYPYGAWRRVLRGPCRGLQYNVQPSMGLSYALGRGLKDDFFSRVVRPGMTVIDVGANVGHMALLFARLVGPTGRVISLEPMPHLADIVKQNVTRNGLRNVEVVAAAASDRAGTVQFEFSDASPTTGRIAGTFVGKSIRRNMEVDTITLDSLGVVPDFMKVDVEGSAHMVLAGADKTLSATPVILAETHNTVERDAVARLGDRGYSFYKLDGLQADPMTFGSKGIWCRVD